MVSGFEMRVGDVEREAAAADLREHFASGRLTQDELNERLDRAFAAKTRGDLHALMTDLPQARPGESPAGPDSAWQYQRRTGDWFGQQGQGQGGWGRGPGRGIGAAIGAFLFLMPVLLVLGMLSVFGIGGGRPFGIVLIVAALALLRRLFFVIFGRRRAGRRGPRRGRR